MTEQEAIKIVCELRINPDVDALSDMLDYLCSLNLEYEFVSDFIHNRFDFADMSGKRIRGYQRKIKYDENGLYSYDYVFGYKDYLHNFNKYWKVYIPSEEEIMLEKQYSKQLKEMFFKGEK